MIQDQNFGIEIEMTGITRETAANVIAGYFSTQVTYKGGVYNKFQVPDNQGRIWQLVRDGSIITQKKSEKQVTDIGDANYSVELVSPICTYEDITAIQEIVRSLRKEGAIANDSTGIHVHVNAAPFDANSLKNLANIMRSKEDLIYKSLQVMVSRENSYCKKTDEDFIRKLNAYKPKTREQLKNIWYNGADGSGQHYHSSRYHALNLHSVFQKGTIEFRLFNSTMHAGKVKTYIQFSLAIANQALTQKRASYTRTASTNEKYTFRTWLLRLGMIGKEFETARMFLLEHLEGNIAWKDASQAEKQKQRLAQQKMEQQAQQVMAEADMSEEENSCEPDWLQERRLEL